MTSKKKTIVIIGAGASGTILAAQIIKRLSANSQSNIKVFLVEKSGIFGPGLAYSTPLTSHILNMRADTLGFPDDRPGHFAGWIKAENRYRSNMNVPETDYPPRSIYGDYLKYILKEALSDAALNGIDAELVKGEVIDITCKNRCHDVLFADGSAVKSDYTVIAPGNFPSAFLNELKGSEGYIPYPWPVSGILDTVPRDAPVCILGSGLSAIDTFFTLMENNHRGKVTFLSRRGFLPKVQGDFRKHEPEYLTAENIKKLLKGPEKNMPFDSIKELYFKEIEYAGTGSIDWLRVFNPDGTAPDILKKDIGKAEGGDIPCQRVLNSSGPLTGMIWRGLSIDDRFRFEMEYKTLWTVYRHPMPLVNARKICSALGSGQLGIESGCMFVRTHKGKGFEIEVSTRLGVPFTIETPFLINATGQGLDVTKFDSPLIKRLLEKGILSPHPNGGIYVDYDSSMILNGDGNIINGLFALGEVTRGVHFFTNGIVPNMNTSKRIAEYIIEDLKT